MDRRFCLWTVPHRFEASGGVPQGLVSSCWGGTYINAWSPPEVIAGCPIFAANSNSTPNADDPNQPSVLYNAMIFPLMPMRIKGVVWYQGCGLSVSLSSASPPHLCL